jgi:hypothetical protein
MELVRLFWMLCRDVDEHLLVIHELLAGEHPAQIKRASAFLDEMRWGTILARPMFVSDALERAANLDDDLFEEVRSAFAAAATSGNHNRRMGEPASRDVSTAKDAREIAERFPRASRARGFFDAMARAAEKRIEESRLEDEEIQER